MKYRSFNDRYTWILKSPPEVVRVGRPVEEVKTDFVEAGRMKFRDANDAVADWLEELKSEKPIVRELEDADGSHVRLSMVPLEPDGVMISLTDIILQKKAEQEKTIKEDQLRQALNNIEGAVLMYDKNLNN